MDISITPHALSGSIESVPSKSRAHRLLICGALSDGENELCIRTVSRDIEATLDCLRSLGSTIEKTDAGYKFLPFSHTTDSAILPCGESGSTLRFLLPVAGALGKDAIFALSGRLPERPIGPLSEALTAHGMKITRLANGNLSVSGTLQSGAYSLRSDISSQFISGLLFALPLLSGDSTLTLSGKIESAPYVAMTEAALKESGIDFEKCENTYYIPGGQQYRPPARINVEGDWSGAAFFLVAGAISGPVKISGLSHTSLQGDKEIINILKAFGAKCTTEKDGITVSPGPLLGQTVDASQIPDLVPIVAVLGAAAKGRTEITGALRLRLKESDRLKTVSAMLSALGGKITETADGLIIEGGMPLPGGTVDSAGDHRIAMSGAIASLLSKGNVVIQGAECVEKSYPNFWEHFAILGGMLERSAW